MRKSFIIFTLLIFSAAAKAQLSNKDFCELTAIGGLYKGGELYGAGVTIGTAPTNNFAFGIGESLVKFKDFSTPYLSFFTDLRYIIKAKSTEPFISIQPGYSLFKYSDTQTAGTIKATTEGKGGFYYGAGIGIKSKHKGLPIVSVRYNSYLFRTTVTSNNFSQSSSSRTGVFSLNLGVVL